MKFDGKKILMLGTNVASVDIINYLKRNGAYVYAIDNLPVEKSQSKQVADESFNISTVDTDAVIELVKDKGITAVLSGISEVNLLQAIRVSEKMNLPFYCSEKQWKKFSEKESFKQICKNNGVTTTNTFYSGDLDGVNEKVISGIEYPIIIKPVDSSASIGVSIVEDKSGLQSALETADHYSKSKRIIIEEYIRGYEFTAHYVVHNKKSRLVSVDNRYPIALHEGKVTTIPAGRVFPSLFIDEFIEQMNEGMIRLCADLGMEYGTLFVQGIYNPDSHEIKLFEGGLRPAAEQVYNLISHINGHNFGRMIIDEIVSGESEYNIDKEDPFFLGKTAGIISIVCRGGEIGTIKGFDEAVNEISSVKYFERRYSEGDIVPDGDTLRQLALRFYLITDSRESMVNDVRRINELIEIRDVHNLAIDAKLIPETILGL